MQADSGSPTVLGELLTSQDPSAVLLKLVHKLTGNGEVEKVIDLFESFISQCPITNAWVYLALAECYRKVGDHAASFLSACAARDAGDISAGLGHIANALFMHLEETGGNEAAISVFRNHFLTFGDAPWSADICKYSALLGIKTAPIATVSGRFDLKLTADSVWKSWVPARAIGGEPPLLVAELQNTKRRAAISMAKIANGSLIVSAGNVAVCDSEGQLISDLGVNDAASLVHWRYQQQPRNFEIHDAQDVVLMSDKWITPNICHFLLDHMPRVGLSERAGIDPSRALYVGSDNQTDFQNQMIKAAGINRYLGANRSAVIRAERVWISSDCRCLQIGANLGAPWAQNYLRRILGRTRIRERRLLISRRDSGRRLLLNEAELMKTLGPLGFEIVALGELQLDQQIQAFADATHIIGPHGAGMSLIVFCGEGTEFAEVFHPQYSSEQFALQAPNRCVHYSSIIGQGSDRGIAGLQYANINLDPALLGEWLKGCGLM